MSKDEILKKITTLIKAISKPTPLLVCIDGVGGAGKTEFARKLASKLQHDGKLVVLCSVDNFHNLMDIRYRRGKNSPEGFYLDSYNYSELQKWLLDPFTSGKGEYRDKIFDVDTNEKVQSSSKSVPSNSILIVEGIFLQRPELVHYWDLKIFLDTDFEVTLQRNIVRAKDQKRIGDANQIVERYNARYMPGELLYFNDAHPKLNADIIIDNNDFENPNLVKINLRAK